MIALALHSHTFYFSAAITIVVLTIGFLSKDINLYLVLFAVMLSVFSSYYAIWLLYQLFSSKRRFIFMERHFTFRSDDILVKFPMVEQVIKWDAFREWSQTSGYYMLIFTNDNWIIIPKSDVPNDKIQDFEIMLRQKIDKIVTIPRVG